MRREPLVLILLLLLVLRQARTLVVLARPQCPRQSREAARTKWQRPERQAVRRRPVRVCRPLVRVRVQAPGQTHHQ